MKQPNTEEAVQHTNDQQNTGNHKVSGAREEGGSDKVGGTRSGAENVESVTKDSNELNVSRKTEATSKEAKSK